jgi:hypothetical protein
LETLEQTAAPSSPQIRSKLSRWPDVAFDAAISEIPNIFGPANLSIPDEYLNE